MQHTFEVADLFNTPQSENRQGNYNLESLVISAGITFKCLTKE
jgi:hypothetical protein